MSFKDLPALLAIALASSTLVQAETINSSFGGALVLAPSVRSVSHGIEGSPSPFPDTTLGAFSAAGALIEANDDGSSLGNSLASGLSSIPVNDDGSIRLSLSGFKDLNFDGLDDIVSFDHFEEGAFEIYVDVFDASGSLIDAVNGSGYLLPGEVKTFSFSDPSWIGGAFNADVDNLVDIMQGDVNFYRFTGLSPGLPFVAEITSGGFDTLLGLFDDQTGKLLDVSDDISDANPLSRIAGVAPASGEVVLAVTGYDDFEFFGGHKQTGDYTLQVFAAPEPSSVGIAILGLAMLVRRRARVLFPAELG